jgi:hypothetical protein
MWHSYVLDAVNSRISPGWHSRASQMASRVLKRMAFALPVFSMDKLARVISTFEANHDIKVGYYWHGSDG